jgi:hypothetical protein
MTYVEQQKRKRAARSRFAADAAETRAAVSRLAADAEGPMEHSTGHDCAGEALTARLEVLCWR